jgi:thymidylate kinase
MSGSESRPMRGLFVVVEGADGSGKSAAVDLLLGGLAEQARPVRAVRREAPVGAEEYASFVSAAGRVFGAAGGLSTDFRVLSLIGAAQYAALVDSQVKPAIESGEVIIAGSWWAKTWARLSIEASRRGALKARKEEFRNWQRQLFPEDLTPAANTITVLLEAPEDDRLRWYAEAGCIGPVYDSAGIPSHEPSEFAKFTTELGNILRSHATSKGWPIIKNGSGRTVQEVADELLGIVSRRLDELERNFTSLK